MAWNRDEEQKAGKAMTLGSCVIGLVFSVFWCVAALSMGAWFMLVFGIPFTCLMGYRLAVCVKMVKGTRPSPPPETDPWDRPAAQLPPRESGGNFCPYCGSGIQEDFAYCPKCGRKQ